MARLNGVPANDFMRKYDVLKYVGELQDEIDSLRKAIASGGGGGGGGTTSSSLPVGLIISYFGSTDTLPSYMLPCDGRILTRASYPKLYAVLPSKFIIDGDTFRLPDLRETTLVGAGTNSKESIDSHDVYEVGQFKDDQLQFHGHQFKNYNGQTVKPNANAGYNWAGVNQNKNTSFDVPNMLPVASGSAGILNFANIELRTGSTTHGKQIGTTYAIVATDYSALPQNAIDDSKETSSNTWSATKILNEIHTGGQGSLINDSMISSMTSWSSQKINTDMDAMRAQRIISYDKVKIGTFVDGRSIYRVFREYTMTAGSGNNKVINHNIPGLDIILNYYGYMPRTDNVTVEVPFDARDSAWFFFLGGYNATTIQYNIGGNLYNVAKDKKFYVIIEYVEQE